MTEQEVKQHYGDVKAEAIAFGEWLLKNEWNATYFEGTSFWQKRTWQEAKLKYQESTTEKLYKEFLNSGRQGI